jgi:hypothetical protein
VKKLEAVCRGFQIDDNSRRIGEIAGKSGVAVENHRACYKVDFVVARLKASA